MLVRDFVMGGSTDVAWIVKFVKARTSPGRSSVRSQRSVIPERARASGWSFSCRKWFMLANSRGTGSLFMTFSTIFHVIFGFLDANWYDRNARLVDSGVSQRRPKIDPESIVLMEHRIDVSR
jgi:hypothetical protein